MARKKEKITITQWIITSAASIILPAYQLLFRSDYINELIDKSIPGASSMPGLATVAVYIILAIMWLLVCLVFIKFLGPAYRFFFSRKAYGNIDSFEEELVEITKLHERYKSNLEEIIKHIEPDYKDRWFYHMWVDKLLIDVRAAFAVLLEHRDVRVALFIEEIIESKKYMILSQTTEILDKPSQRKFEIGSGFCGHAWKNARPHAGAAYIAQLRAFKNIKSLERFVRDKRYAHTNEDDKEKSFLALPIRHESYGSDLTAILCVDSSHMDDFLLNGKTIKRINDSLKQLFPIILYHKINGGILKYDHRPIDKYVEGKKSKQTMPL